jgi:hypothetical protein
MSVFDSMTPTQEELESCMWVILTGDEIWDPKSESFAAEEEKKNISRIARSNNEIDSL